MNEGLNRAFIRAYDKEKSSEARRKHQAQQQQADELSRLMVQFDTATIDIPAPHMLQAKKRIAEEAVVGAPVRSSRPTSAASIPQPSVPSQDVSLAADEGLRDSIAEQMLRAVSWEQQALGTFTGEVRLQSGLPGNRQSAERGGNVTVAQGSSGQAGDVPQSPAPGVNVGVAGERETLLRESSVLRRDSIAERPLPAANTAGARASEALPLATGAAASQSDARQQPNSTAAAPEHLPLAVSTPTESSPSAADPSGVRREKSGNIFRLDRPSYHREAGTPAPDMLDVEDEKTEALELACDAVDEQASSASDTQWLDRTRIPLGRVDSPVLAAPHVGRTRDTDATPAKRNPLADAEAKELEKRLREAKVRIFNPVWEVDNLQWPPVCLELMHRMSSNFKSIAENLAAACQDGLQVMAVTSPQRGEGTTTVACCLALLAGSHGLNVAIVDGDLEKPTLSYQTNLDVEQDWRGALINDLALEEVAIHSIDDQVTVVPLLNPISEFEMTSGDERIINMMRELTSCFDLVIVDAGRVDSTRSLIRTLGERGLISAAVAVVDHRSSTPDRIEACLRRIRQAGVHSIGLVENFAA
jgi:Mrp family chromosome partitioning ATPase